jgi:hypothetical protein
MGQRYFTFDVFNIRIDADAAAMTVEDELDVNRQCTIALTEVADPDRHLLPRGLPWPGISPCDYAATTTHRRSRSPGTRPWLRP